MHWYGCLFKDMFFRKLQDHGNLPLYGFVNPWLVLLARLSQGRREFGKNFHHLVPNNLPGVLIGLVTNRGVWLSFSLHTA